LLKTIYESLPDLISFKIKLPLVEQTHPLVSWIYDKAHVQDISYNDNVILSVECNIEIYKKIVSKSNDVNGVVF